MIPDLANPQSWNRFGYVQNNPIRYNDPTGHMVEEGDGAGASTCDQKCLDQLKKDKEKDNADADDGCNGWDVCVSNISSDYAKDYWAWNKGLLGHYNSWTSRFGLGGLFIGFIGFVVHKMTGGQPIVTPEIVALFTGISLIEPTFLLEVAVVVGLVSEGIAYGLNRAANNLQDINDAMVESGFRENGGTITASFTEVTIETSSGTTNVPSFGVGWLSLYSWADTTLYHQ